jgi:hypothetical protein
MPTMSKPYLPRISLEHPYGVLSAAFVLISHFSDSLYLEIDTGLRKLYGEHWIKKFQNENLLTHEFNSRDPQSILKELARNGASQFRLPLNSRIERENLARFYDGLDDLLGERNAWVHRQLSEDISELKDLAETASALLKMCTLDFDYALWLSELLTVEQITTVQSSERYVDLTVNMTPEEAEDSNDMNKVQKVQLSHGDAVTARFLTHSYVVGEGGDVIDRTTGVRLSQFNSGYQKKLVPLISDLRSGSRLRLTAEAQLCSFFDDHWGFLADISPEEWFPNHLK